MKRLSVLICVFGWLILGSCDEELTKVVIFHTNDSHGSLNELAEVAWYVANEKELTDYVFLVSAGDIFSGNPVVDYFDPPGYPKIDLMNLAGYNLAVIGNHEFDYGVDELNNRIEQAQFPFILANIVTGNLGLLQPPPYANLEAGNVNIAFVGLVQVGRGGIPLTHPRRVEGFTFSPPEKEIENYRRLNSKYDAVIALSHSGFITDTIIAAGNSWLDVIIGGHSHTLTISPSQFNGVVVTHAGSGLSHLGKVTLIFYGNKLIDKYGEMIPLNGEGGVVQEIRDKAQEYSENRYISSLAGSLDKPLRGKNALGAFVADVLRDYGNYDIAFHNFGGVRINNLSDDVTIGDIYTLDPFNNELVYINLTYNEIKSLVKGSLSRDLISSLQVSGAQIELLVDNGGALRDIKIFKDEQELQNNRKYTVAMNDYIYSAYWFTREDSATGTGLKTAQILIDYFLRKGIVSYDDPGTGRVLIVRG